MKLVRIATLIIIVLTSTSSLFATLVDLTDTGLGFSKGNYGTSLFINDDLTLTALTSISGESSLTGTIYIDNHQKGIGVQNNHSGGSKGISGGGGDQDEALILGFNSAITAGSLQIGLNEYEQCKDSPVITLQLSGGQELSFNKSHQNWSNAVTSNGGKKITIDVGTILGTDFSGSVNQVSVMESTGHIYVNSVNYETATTAVPEPCTIAMLFMGLMIIRTQKQ